MKTTYLLLKIEHTKDIPNLAFFAEDRIYRMDKVENVTASLLTQEQASSLNQLEQVGKPPSKFLSFLLQCIRLRA